MRINRVTLIAAMAAREIGVSDLAKAAGVSRGTVTAIRTGKACSGATAAKLAHALGMSIDDLKEEKA